MRIDLFRMERMQSLHWHRVEYDLSESGVRPLTVAEVLGDASAPAAFLETALGYPLSEGSELLRERVAAFYPGARAENVTVANGGSEAKHLTLWTLLEPGDRLAVMVPNARTREIVRRQWPRLEAWLRRHEDVFEWVAPAAGAIALARYRLPVGSTALVDRIRREQSVLLVPGDMLWAGRSLRFGFGYDVDRTLAGLARVDATLARLVRKRAPSRRRRSADGHLQ